MGDVERRPAAVLDVLAAVAVAALLVAVAVWTDDAISFARDQGLMPLPPDVTEML